MFSLLSLLLGRRFTSTLSRTVVLSQSATFFTLGLLLGVLPICPYPAMEPLASWLTELTVDLEATNRKVVHL